MVASTQELEGLFRPNDSLEAVVFRAAREDGCGLIESLLIRRQVNRMTFAQRAELERQLSDKLQSDVESGLVKLPVNAKFDGGRLVTGWQDLFQWFLDNWPVILEMIAAIIALF